MTDDELKALVASLAIDYSGPQKTDSTIRWCLSKKVGQNE